jgi:hypothetical protein
MYTALPKCEAYRRTRGGRFLYPLSFIVLSSPEFRFLHPVKFFPKQIETNPFPEGEGARVICFLKKVPIFGEKWYFFAQKWKNK